MHEGDHGILDHDREHDRHAASVDRGAGASRVVAAVVVAASVVLFLVWRFL